MKPKKPLPFLNKPIENSETLEAYIASKNLSSSEKLELAEQLKKLVRTRSGIYHRYHTASCKISAMKSYIYYGPISSCPTGMITVTLEDYYPEDNEDRWLTIHVDVNQLRRISLNLTTS